jgi:hypothetical protein
MPGRDRQERYIADLINRAPMSGSLAKHLVANGVSVELPPEPEVKPGTTGIATIGGEPVRWLKDWDGWQYVGERTQGWTKDAAIELRDIVADPELLTEEVVEKVVAYVRYGGQPGHTLETLVRAALAPYVAKDA